MASAYKLTYFDSPGLAEPARYLFLYGDIDFEDIRIQKEDWPALKPNTPYGVLPILEHNGKIVSQTVAITKYVAKLVGLTGNDPWEDLEIDSIVDTFVDFKDKDVEIALEEDETKKSTLKATFVGETIPFYMQRFEDQIKKNNGHFVNGKLTWADIFISLILVVIASRLEVDLFAKYPATKKLCDEVLANEKYKKYQETLKSK